MTEHKKLAKLKSQNLEIMCRDKFRTNMLKIACDIVIQPNFYEAALSGFVHDGRKNACKTPSRNLKTMRNGKFRRPVWKMAEIL